MFAPHYFGPAYFGGSFFGAGGVLDIAPFVPPGRTVVMGSGRWGRQLFAAARAQQWPLAQVRGEPSRYKLDYSSETARRWEHREVVFGERIRAGSYDAECVTPGRTGRYEPRWPKVVGTPVPDGSAVWAIRMPTTLSVIQVASVTWDVPEGLSVAGKLHTATDTSAVPAASAPGLHKIIIKVRYASGEGFDQPCLLRVE